MKYIEKNKKIRRLEISCIIVLILLSLFLFINTYLTINNHVKLSSFVSEVNMVTNLDDYEYSEENKVCPITYYDGDNGSICIEYSFDEYVNIKNESIKGYKYITTDGISLYFLANNPSNNEIRTAIINNLSNKIIPVYNVAISCLILVIVLFIIYFFGDLFTTYEKIWFISIMVLTTIFSYLFPEENSNGINGIIIMSLYLLDTFLNILCELLISKQSRYNFIVSILVEITEILLCIVLMYRFATMAATLFFWLPIDIISFINWSKHIDKEDELLTSVRRLKGYQEVLVIVGIMLWTLIVGYILSGLNIQTDFIKDKAIATLIIYLDACASAVGIANGLFIFFRLQEQWIAWYISAILETIMNFLAGQYVLLILKLGYFTNTTYGYIKWNKYIKKHKDNIKSLF